MSNTLTKPTPKGARTRDRILDIAEASVLAKGFAATSIEEIIAEAEITKSGFFYHFRDKTQLARALLQRFLQADDVLLDDLFARARELTDDPLHAYLVGFRLFAEAMEEMEDVHPGCMVAAVAYQARQFDAEVRTLARDGMVNWRLRFREMLDAIAVKYPPHEEIDLDALADQASVLVEGGIVLAKLFEDQNLLAGQILLHRTFVKTLFSPR